MVHEYSGYAPSSGCAYSTLCGYYSNGKRAVMGPQPATSNALQIVPVFGGASFAPQYKYAVKSCNGYNNITSAYKNYPQCAAYTTRLCSGGCGYN